MWSVNVILCFLWFTCASGGSSSPLVLTSYLHKNEIDKARELSKVTPDLGNVLSYSGYFTVNRNLTCGNNLFFWFFPAAKDWENAPVVLWLQGGPGSSSMLGLFKLNGPFNSFPEGLKARNTSWHNFANVIYIDNPVGAGFSFTKNKCYPQSIEAVAEELHFALRQFFMLFPELQKNDFFLSGQSFAGHYIPALATLIDERNSQRGTPINMKGIVLGNPSIQITCNDYGSYLYQVGIVDDAQRDNMKAAQDELNTYVKNKNYKAASDKWNSILSDLVLDQTGLTKTTSILNEPDDRSNYITFLNTTDVRNQLHAGSQEFLDQSDESYDNLIDTMAQPYSSNVERLLSTKKYFVVFYSGNLDINCLYTSTVCVMRGLNWPGRENYLKATRNMWYLNDELVGWFKSADNLLYDVVVKDAQHAAIYSKPEVTYRMMKSIVSAKPGQNNLWDLQTTTSSE